MEKVKTTKLQLLRRDFENLCMKESDNIDSFLIHVIGMVTQIRTHGEILEKRRIVEKLLRILPSKFDVIVTTIEETKDLSNFSVDELHASLITHEQRLSRNENSSLGKALKTHMTFGRGRGQAEEAREEEAEAKTEVEETVQQMLKEEATIQIRTKAKAAVNKVDIIMLKDKGNISLFSALDQNVKSQVTHGTDSKVSIMGKGEVKIFTKKGENKTIADVYYVPGMKCNLLSIGQLVQKGYNVFFLNDVCTIMDRAPNKRCISEVKMTTNRIFHLKIKADLKNKEVIAAVTQEAFQSIPKDENWLWHLRFGHLNFGGLNLLSRKGMVRGLPLIEKSDNLCEGCILGKQNRESFPSGKSIRAKAPLEIVHSDVCGPMQTPSLAGNQCFLTFIDDFTRKTWVYFLKKKSEMFENFRNFKKLVENQSGLHIKVLRTDRGGEYISKEFLHFCRENGIHKQFTTRYSLQ
eukprot:PITA_25358